MYTPPALIVPTEEFPPGMVSTSHVTAVELPDTLAVKVCNCPVVNPTRTGLTLTVTGTEVIVIVTTVVLVMSKTDVAVANTVGGVGAVAGAVYVIATPDALEADDSVPQLAPAQPTPANIHVTPLFCGSFVTVAVRF